jgi:hypothetical protein
MTLPPGPVTVSAGQAFPVGRYEQAFCTFDHYRASGLHVASGGFGKFLGSGDVAHALRQHG